MEKKLQRNENDKMIAGVCSGLAEYFDVDVTWIRIAFVIATLAGASGVLAYIVLWIAVPLRPFSADFNRYHSDYKVHEESMYSQGQQYAGYVPNVPKKTGNGRAIVGVLFVTLGLYFLLNEMNLIPRWFELDKLWPMILVFIGVYLISRAGKKKPETPFPFQEETRAASDPVTVSPEVTDVSTDSSDETNTTNPNSAK